MIDKNELDNVDGFSATSIMDSSLMEKIFACHAAATRHYETDNKNINASTCIFSETKTYHFDCMGRELVVSVPAENRNVCTSRFCPPDLLTGGLSYIPAVNGESEENFIAICRKLIEGVRRSLQLGYSSLTADCATTLDAPSEIALNATPDATPGNAQDATPDQASEDDDIFMSYTSGLLSLIMEHVAGYGRLIFSDLLAYMDCFSLLLEADGMPADEIRRMYPEVTNTIVGLYGDFVRNTHDLTPFKGGRFDLLLQKAAREAASQSA